MTSAEFLRTLNVGSNWGRIRVGILFGLSAVGYNAGYTGSIILGLSSGKAFGYNSLSTTNFIGANAIASTALGTVYGRYGPPYYFQCYGNCVLKRVGNTTTIGPTGGGYAYNAGAVTNQSQRCAFYLDITKGSPNYTVTTYIPAWWYNDPGTFINGVNSFGTPGNTGVSVNAQPFAVDESAGGFDTFSLYCGFSNPVVHVWYVAIARLLV